MDPMFCEDCGKELCEHGNCAEDCALTGPDCDCFDEPLTMMDIVRRSLDDQEPTHAFKWPVYRP